MLMVVCFAFLASGTFGEVVESPSGNLEGLERTSRDGRRYMAWTKIPYAKPPVGPLRLAAPEPIEKWQGILNATGPAPRCIQAFSQSRNRRNGQEDCLYLNIYKPKTDQKLLPVMVYIHGGAFFTGDPGPPKTADYFMDEDVILVTVAYRLGAFGFMSLNDPVLPGNFGMKDQALAIRWIKDNVAAFGGNPDSITPFGISAGGASTHSLLLSPLTKDLVTRSIAISGTVSKLWSFRRPAKVVQTTRSLVERMGCTRDDSPAILACLRDVTNTDLFSKYGDLSKLEPAIPLGPIIEIEGPGAFAPTDLTKTETSKPLMITYSAGEYLLSEVAGSNVGMFKMKQIASALDEFCASFLKPYVTEEHLPLGVKQLREKYMSHTDPEEVNHDLAMVVQDAIFVYPAIWAADVHKGPKWVYHMEHKGEVTLFDVMMLKTNATVPCHGDEMFLLFNLRDFVKKVNRPMNSEDLRVSKELIKYMANFAKYDNPTPDGSALNWKPYKGDEILLIKTEGSVMADGNFIKEQKNIRDRWNDILGYTEWF